MKTVAERQATLRDRLKELDQRLHQIDDELESHSSRGWEELAVERETDEVLEGMGLSGLAEIRVIKAALARVDADEYGDCVSCGERISEARLDVVPFTPFCRKCASENSAAR